LRYLGVNEEDAAELYGEAFEIIRQALSEGALNYKGKHWSFDDVRLSVRPFQTPHPPIWYASASAESAVWPAKNGINLICAGPTDRVRAITDRYRSEQKKTFGDKGSVGTNQLGINRYIFVGDTDKEALAASQRAWPHFHHSFWTLWLRHGGEPKTFKVPSDLSPLLQSGIAIIGSPDTVRAELTRQVSDSGINYMSGHLRSAISASMRSPILSDCSQHTSCLLCGRPMKRYGTNSRLLRELGRAGGGRTIPAGRQDKSRDWGRERPW
jgi:alkanesulfonate monooxygenase SsuD/methylene tetrahydromethanopterin reductase-like flavin-dependent oxidoreductase (luciferase family)